MRDSRIEHPRGGSYIQVHRWAVKAIGKSAATILGQFDFLDRADQKLVSRARIIADLEGFVGKNVIDADLKLLEKMKWITCHEKRLMGPRNLQISLEFSLNVAVINNFLKGAPEPDTESDSSPESEFGTGEKNGNPGVPEMGTQETRGIPEKGTRESQNRDRHRSLNRDSSIGNRSRHKTTPPPTPAGGGDGDGDGDEIDEMIEAAYWEAKNTGNRILSPGSWEAKLRARMEKHISPADRAALEAFRKFRDAPNIEAVFLADGTYVSALGSVFKVRGSIVNITKPDGSVEGQPTTHILHLIKSGLVLSPLEYKSSACINSELAYSALD